MKGFSLIELIVVITIIIISAAAVQVSLVSFQKQSDLTTLTQNILSILRKAQSNSIESKNFSSHGVYFESQAYTLFQGTNYNVSSPINERYAVPSRLEIYAINLVGGDNSVVFERIDGRTVNAGNIQFRVKADPSASSTITIEPSGNVSVQKNVTTSNTRMTDNRHIHFDLGWSIQGATTLTLTFKDPPNPDIVQNIVMASYFTAPNIFNWEGATAVGGQEQKLQISSHSITATNTLLSIIRDARYNSKAVDISIDAKTIVSYSVLGIPTVGLFGGAIQAQ